MTDVSATLPPPIEAPGYLGQATEVEKSRAVAEVMGAIVVAQRVPRSVDRARLQMQEVCKLEAFAERAFWSFPRAGENLSGPSIAFAREMARCWGNVQYGIAELLRDDEARRSEMLAFAWDVQANTRASTTFIVPHVRDRSAKKGGPQPLVELRDVYENNSNQGSRRLRQQILGVLPEWFVGEALDICKATLNQNDKRPLPERQRGAVAAFESVGVVESRLVQKMGRPVDRWTVFDLAQLRITLREIQTGALIVDDAFPPVRVTAAEVKEQAARMTPAIEASVVVDAAGNEYDPDDLERPFTEGGA